jgi:hypothetical protein
MHEHGCLHVHIKNKNLYKTEPKKVTSAICKKNLTIICQKQNSRTNIGSIQIVAHLKRFCWTHHLSKSYEKLIRKLQHQRFFMIHPVYFLANDN